MKTMQWLALGACRRVLAAPAAAQDYPSKPITIISAQASGGASDTVVRAVQERMQAALGQPLVLENRPGAGGNVGAAAVARAAPDGYTLMVGTDAMMTSNVHLYKSMGFDPVKDFAPITNAGANIIVLAVHADVPAKSVAELVAYAKANPGKVQYGSSGVASPHHLAGELLKLKTGIDIVHVPYRGGALSANDLAGGHIAMAFASYSAIVGLIPTGKIRILARGREDALRRPAGCADGRRNHSGLRDVVVARLLRAGRDTRADRHAAARRVRQDAQGRYGEGAARRGRACRGGGNAGGAGRNRPQRHRRARRTDQGRQDRAAVAPQRHSGARRLAREPGIHNPQHSNIRFREYGFPRPRFARPE